MSGLEQCCGPKDLESMDFLQRQVQVLRHLLERSEAALAEKRAKEQARCFHARQIVVPCGGPRDNGELDYQCIDCGALL